MSHRINYERRTIFRMQKFQPATWSVWCECEVGTYVHQTLKSHNIMITSDALNALLLFYVIIINSSNRRHYFKETLLWRKVQLYSSALWLQFNEHVCSFSIVKYYHMEWLFVVLVRSMSENLMLVSLLTSVKEWLWNVEF